MWFTFQRVTLTPRIVFTLKWLSYFGLRPYNPLLLTFSCQLGHVYAIGECGGANQKGKCPECNADIGGVSHRLAEGNTLAREMDGATFAAYSEEANNMMNFDLQNLF